MKEIINTSLAPKPGGHFSQATKKNNTVYVAGQAPVDIKLVRFQRLSKNRQE